MRGDKECPISGVTNSGSLDEGAKKRCSECGSGGECLRIVNRYQNTRYWALVDTQMVVVLTL